MFLLFFSGTGIACFEMYFLSRPVGLRNRLYRGFFIAGPIVAMATSFVAAKEILSNVSEMAGTSRDRTITYSAATLAPSLVAGMCCKLSSIS